MSEAIININELPNTLINLIPIKSSRLRAKWLNDSLTLSPIIEQTENVLTEVRGAAKGSKFTVEKFLANKQEEINREYE